MSDYCILLAIDGNRGYRDTGHSDWWHRITIVIPFAKCDVTMMDHGDSKICEMICADLILLHKLPIQSLQIIPWVSVLLVTKYGGSKVIILECRRSLLSTWTYMHMYYIYIYTYIFTCTHLNQYVRRHQLQSAFVDAYHYKQFWTYKNRSMMMYACIFACIYLYIWWFLKKKSEPPKMDGSLRKKRWKPWMISRSPILNKLPPIHTWSQ